MALHKEEELAKKKCGQSFVTAGTKEVYFTNSKFHHVVGGDIKLFFPCNIVKRFFATRKFVNIYQISTKIYEDIYKKP